MSLSASLAIFPEFQAEVDGAGSTGVFNPFTGYYASSLDTKRGINAHP